MDYKAMGSQASLFRTREHMDLVRQHMAMLKDGARYKPYSVPNTGSYVWDDTATRADVKEYPNSYVYEVDMPGLKSGDIKVSVEDHNVLMICWERKRGEEKKRPKYLRTERRVGKYMRRFVLTENADTGAVSAVCQDGVLSVTVQKLPPPQPKKPRIIEVKVA